jgi:hypothetical protein
MSVRPGLLALATAVAVAAPLTAGDLSSPLAVIRQVGPDSAGGSGAAQAWRELAAADVGDLPALLAGMDGASPLARNWLRSAAGVVLERAAADKKPLPTAALEAFLRDTKHDPQARRLAYDVLGEADPTTPDRFLPNMVDDPSPTLRYDAIARLLDGAEKAFGAEKKAEALPLFRQALAGARDQGQIDQAARRLRDLGEPVDLPTRLGLILTWKVIGPFPNADQKGLDTVYPPEKGLDFAAEYDGKAGKLKWADYVSKDDHGAVDLKAALGDVSEVVHYAAAGFTSREARDVEVRLGSWVGVKVWVNGELALFRGDSYTGSKLDSYVGKARLKPGKNTILVKFAQDAPPEQLPKMMKFQLRVCDTNGVAVLSADRPAAKP